MLGCRMSEVSAVADSVMLVPDCAISSLWRVTTLMLDSLI